MRTRLELAMCQNLTFQINIYILDDDEAGNYDHLLFTLITMEPMVGPGPPLEA